MRTVHVSEITENIKEMCIEANHFLTEDMKCALTTGAKEEKAPLGRQILEQLQENLNIAGEDMIPICQDTGMAVIFMEIGQEVHFEGGVLEDAIHEGVRRGYTDRHTAPFVRGTRECAADRFPADPAAAPVRPALPARGRETVPAAPPRPDGADNPP